MHILTVVQHAADALLGQQHSSSLHILQFAQSDMNFLL